MKLLPDPCLNPMVQDTQGVGERGRSGTGKRRGIRMHGCWSSMKESSPAGLEQSMAAPKPAGRSHPVSGKG